MDTTCMVWQVIQEYGNSINLEPSPYHILYGHKEMVTCVDISNELDMVISGSLDGTVNIHTLRSGSYVKTLSFANEKISIFKDINIKLSNERHILVYAGGQAFDKPNDFSTTHSKKMFYELYLFSINGQLISREQLQYPVQDMIIKDDYCVLAVLVNNSTKSHTQNAKDQQGANTSLNSSFGQIETEHETKQKNNVTSSKIIFKEYFE